MQSSTFDSNSTERTVPKRVTAAQRYAELKRLFDRVTQTYLTIRQYPALAACDPDPDPVVRSRRWTPNFAHFLVDAEKVTEEALRDAPDAPALQAAWFSIVQGDAVDPEIEREVVTRCGRLYRSRKIDPRLYFNIRTDGGSR